MEQSSVLSQKKDFSSSSSSSVRSAVTLSKWISGICVVHFDLEYGQMLERIIPEDLSLSKSEVTNICFLSFPDSNSHREGDATFTFRIRKGATKDMLHQKYLYGFVFFRQQRDLTIDRGFLQKSVVLLTERAYYGLFQSVVVMLGEAFFEHGPSVLEVATASIRTWEGPRAGKTYKLPLLGTVLQFHIPYSLSPHMVDGEAPVPRSHKHQPTLVSNMDAIDVYHLFRRQLTTLWRIWEIALINEPLLVCSSSPHCCSNAVISIVSLIAPLKYYGDFRPYFTIHDTEFKEFTQPEISPVILGTTNPFFIKALSHWPHILYVNGSLVDSSRSSHISRRKNISKESIPKQKLVSKEKLLMSTDKQMMRQLLSRSDGDNPELNKPLRRYFLDLTERFLIPLESYVATLMPLEKDVSPFKEKPQMKPFKTVDFLSHVNTIIKKPYLTGKSSKDMMLYRRFLLSLNFKGWLRIRQQRTKKHLTTLYMEKLLTLDTLELVHDKSDVEIIDLYIRVKEQLMDVPSDSTIFKRLKKKLKNILECLSEELQVSILSNEKATNGCLIKQHTKQVKSVQE